MYPCPVFDEESEITDSEFSEMLFMLVNERHFSLEDLQAYWDTFVIRSGKAN